VERTFQSRLGQYHDRIRKKLIDNKISLTGQPVDCIRVRNKLTKQGDIETRVVDDATVLPIIFPPLKDVPYRRMTSTGTTGAMQFQLETLPSVMDLFPIEIICTQASQLYMDDLIFRIFVDDATPVPLVLCLQVVEPKGTFGVSSMIYGKFDCTFYREELPSEMLETVVMLGKRRLSLGW
jgi:hypothetical protein